MTAALNGNKTANINVKKLQYIQIVNGDIHASKTAKTIKGDISRQLVTEMSTCRRLISPFMIFAVFDA